jgi:hypothetical protein
MYQVPRKVGPKARPYTVLASSIDEEWFGRNGGGWFGRRPVGAKPSTTADEKAWRRDGSPSRWDLGPADSPGGRHLFLMTVPGKGTLQKVPRPNAPQVLIAGPDASFADLQRLPSDPGTLRKLAEKYALQDGDGIPVEAANEQVRQTLVARRLIDLLAAAPVTPKVRAGAFRALAEMPVVKSQGKAVDERGRRGVAFSIVAPYEGSTTGTRLIIDPGTSQVLSEHMISRPSAKAIPGKERTTLYLGSGWTDQAPRPPALP